MRCEISKRAFCLDTLTITTYPPWLPLHIRVHSVVLDADCSRVKLLSLSTIRFIFVYYDVSIGGLKHFGLLYFGIITEHDLVIKSFLRN